MRWILALALASGCTSETATGGNGVHVVIGLEEWADGPIAWRSMYPSSLDGVHFGDGAGWAIAGMDGMTCRLHFQFGAVDVDEDMGDGRDTVWDGFPGDDGSTTVVVHGTDDLTFGEFPSGDVLWSLPAPDALRGRATQDALVLLRDDAGCALDWIGPDGDVTAQLDEAVCDDRDPDLEIDGEDGVA